MDTIFQEHLNSARPAATTTSARPEHSILFSLLVYQAAGFKGS